MLLLKFKDSEDVYHVEFSQSSTNVVSIISQEQLPTFSEGFCIYREETPDIVLGNYLDYTTVYRAIDKFTYQYSNDGSQYVAPTKSFTVQAFWNDQDDLMEARPSSVMVQIYCNGKKSTKVELKASKGWKVTYKERPIENVYTIVPDDVPPYEQAVSGTTVTYSLAIPQPRQITTDDLAECILDEESANKLNIYASYCENNLKNFYDNVPEDYQAAVEAVIAADGFMVNEDGTCSVRPFNAEV